MFCMVREKIMDYFYPLSFPIRTTELRVVLDAPWGGRDICPASSAGLRMEDKDLVPWIAMNMLPGVGAVALRRALERYGDPEKIAYRLPREILQIRRQKGGGGDSFEKARKGLERRARRELRRCRERGIRVVTFNDSDYPAALAELPDKPPLLYIKGELPQRAFRVAIVGSRSPTIYGKRVAAGLASGLAARGIEVVSGGARGIDTTAHRAALADGGRTVAVLGSGLSNPYPPENDALFSEIASSGALLSELPLEGEPKSEHFPRRNRLISGLSAAVVVVEAALRSGTSITAAHALEQGREVLAVPGPVSSRKSEGCHKLIQQGAKLVQNIEDILEEVSPMYLTALPQKAASWPEADMADLEGLTADEAQVLGLLDRAEPIQIDDLANRAPFGIARLQTALFGLEVRGAVEHSPGRYYLLRPRKEN
jgi:DNA processing protein